MRVARPSELFEGPEPRPLDGGTAPDQPDQPDRQPEREPHVA
jgi:hypothetical protein